jgi:hypothetical protein
LGECERAFERAASHLTEKVSVEVSLRETFGGSEKAFAHQAGLLPWHRLKAFISSVSLFALLFASPARAGDAPAASHLQAPPWNDPGFFPIAVWLQDPANAERYKQAGINTYVGLWKGPTEGQISALKKAGMRLICSQNAVALKHLDDPTIIAWMHDDEPDNAQSLGAGKGYGPPILPSKIIEDYAQIRKADPRRPVMLNLGQGVACDDYIGRGTRTRHPEDYPEYIKGCDIVSFDIYPAVHDAVAVKGNLWYVATGVERLVRWSGGRKLVWNCLECTHISNPDRKPTPREVRSEAWMALIHGSQGLIYFVHQFKPKFREAALLDDPEMVEAVTRLNRQVTELAPVLKSPGLTNEVKVNSSNAAVPIAAMVKKTAEARFIFAAAMRAGETQATFSVSGVGSVEVLGENRTIPVKDGTFEDSFADWDVHLYRGQSRAR